MELIKAMYARHAVRHFDGKSIKSEDRKQLNTFIKNLNKKSGLNMQLIVNEPKAFGGKKAKRCNFTGCVNYLAIVGPNNSKLKEKAGYWGEQVVLKAQTMGINSCWVALTFNKIKNTYKVNKNQKLALVVALGYGTTQGHPHESKRFGQVVTNREKLPPWFVKGVKYALLAPTGVNKQGFKFTLLKGNKVKVKNRSLCKKVDLGIIKFHFELGAGKENFTWAK